MCFGSFIMTIFWACREILDFLRQFKVNNVAILTYLGSLAECILLCNQACWEIASTNSHYITAIYGFGYCTATKKTIELTDNALHRSVGLVGNALVYVCIFTIALASATVGITVLSIESVDIRDQIQVGSLLFLIALGLSWMILSVYVNITRTLYICIAIEIEKNKSTMIRHPIDADIPIYIEKVGKFTEHPPRRIVKPAPTPPYHKGEESGDDDDDEEEEEEMVERIMEEEN